MTTAILSGDGIYTDSCVVSQAAPGSIFYIGSGKKVFTSSDNKVALAVIGLHLTEDAAAQIDRVLRPHLVDYYANPGVKTVAGIFGDILPRASAADQCIFVITDSHRFILKHTRGNPDICMHIVPDGMCYYKGAGDTYAALAHRRTGSATAAIEFAIKTTGTSKPPIQVKRMCELVPLIDVIDDVPQEIAQ